jgi:Rrf2 family protein
MFIEVIKMKISTRGRYAVRVMIDLAQHDTGSYVPLMDIAKRQEISEKYLEAIVSILSKNNFLLSLRGKGGGYKLARPAASYTVASILKLVEGSFAPVVCLEKTPNPCKRAPKCLTLKMWKGFQKITEDYFGGITVEDLVKQKLT